MEINKSVFDRFPVLQTKRLTLREIRPEDADEIFKMRTNGRVNQFIARPEMENLDSSKELVRKTIEAYKNLQGIGWAGVRQDGGSIIGTCGFNSIDYPNLRAEIGGEMSTDHWGKKLAFEAVEAIVNFGLFEMNLHSIEAKVQPGNRGAIYVLSQLGFEKEGHHVDRIFYKGKFLDMAIYTKVKGH